MRASLGLERKGLDVGLHGEAGRLEKERAPVLAGVVGDAPDDALAVEKLVRDRRGVGHVDAPEGERAALFESGEGGGYQLAGWSEDDRRVESRRWRLGGPADPRSPQLRRKRLVPLSVARHDVDVGPPPAGDLERDVPGGAEAVDPETGPLPRERRVGEAGEFQRAEADDPGAEKRRGRKVAEAVRELVDEACGRDGEVGEAAVGRPAGELRRVAEVLAPRPAEAARPAGSMKPGDADAEAVRQRRARAALLDGADDLMSRRDGRLPDGKLSLDDVEIGSADAAGRDADEDLAGAGLRDWDIFEPQRLFRDGGGTVEAKGAHRGTSGP